MNLTKGTHGSSTIGGLAALVAVAIVGQYSLNLSHQRDDTSAVYPGEVVSAHMIFLDDMMLAGYSPDGIARQEGVFEDVVTGTDRDQVRFVADVDSDGVSDRVTYEIRSGSLIRTLESREAGQWRIVNSAEVLDRVTTFRLRFLDQNRTPLAADQGQIRQPAAVRSVHMILSRGGPSPEDPASETFAGEVAIRNLAV